jgi:anti-sigma regulatory factor (Ser/Thr protein kinase)
MALISAHSQADTVISVNQTTDVAQARRAVLKVASHVGFTAEDAGAAAIIVTEAASNLIKHGGGGEMIVRNIAFSDGPLLEILAIDRGKGMTSISRCFQDGYSTGSSPGTGLGAIARLSKFHDIYSVPEKGTVLLVQTGPARVRSDGLQTSVMNIAYPGEELCGDAWRCDVTPLRTRFIVADGLGHGVFAAEAAHSSIRYIGESNRPQPADAIEDAHLRLRATRGAAVAIADVDLTAGRVTFAGVGNVAGAIVSSAGTKRQMVSINGTLGHQMTRARQYEYSFEADSLLILHSDGLSANWFPDKYPGLFQRHPGVIAGVLFRDFRRIRDDATVAVARWTGVPA